MEYSAEERREKEPASEKTTTEKEAADYERAGIRGAEDGSGPGIVSSTGLVILDVISNPPNLLDFIILLGLSFGVRPLPCEPDRFQKICNEEMALFQKTLSRKQK